MDNIHVNGDTVKEHPFVVIIMLLIIVGFMIYGLHYYFSNKSEYAYNSNSSYYGKKLLDYMPLFQISSDNLIECVNRCNADILCSGITYNTTTQECIGTSGEGILRQDTSELVSWVKPSSSLGTTTGKDFTKSIILGYADTPSNIPSNKISQPQMAGSYCLSFNLCIRDYHHNYGKWRHILHKGTTPSPSKPYDYTSWENLVIDNPKQFIGVWLAPFNNNIRIAVSTAYMPHVAQNYYDHANVQICDDTGCYMSDVDKTSKDSANTVLSIAPQKVKKNLEFIDHDITSVPLNRVANYTINVMSNNIELYSDGKLVKSAVLEGTPDFNNEPMYIMQPTSINGYISNIIYYPAYCTLDDIAAIQSIPFKSLPK